MEIGLDGRPKLRELLERGGVAAPDFGGDRCQRRIALWIAIGILARGDPHHLHGVADHVGGAALAIRSFLASEHSIGICGLLREGLEHVPVLDDLSIGIKSENVYPGVVFVARPTL